MADITTIDPSHMRVVRAASWSGVSRSRLYVLMAEGRINAVKEGGSTLIEVSSLRSYLESLPAATFRPIPKAA